MNKHEIIIIGSGPAGLTAAIYAARANLNPLIIAGFAPGGQLINTTEVENFPGFPEGIMGPQLMQNMIKQAERFGTTFVYDVVKEVDFSGNNKKVMVGSQVYEAASVILATGSSYRMLGLESERKFFGRGVSTCATCDGAFYKEKTVAVIGGGDSAMEESNFLTKFAKKVYIVHRKKEFKASKIMQQRVLRNEKIEIIWDSEVSEIIGETVVTGLKIKNVINQEERALNVDGVFLAIGHIPNTDFLAGQIGLDEKGYIKVIEGHTKTTVPGVFVAGDVYDFHYQQAITAAGMGCMAALDAQAYLESPKY